MKPIGTGTRQLSLDRTAWTRPQNTGSTDVYNYIDAKLTIHYPTRHSSVHPADDTWNYGQLCRLHMILAQAAQDIPRLNIT